MRTDDAAQETTFSIHEELHDSTQRRQEPRLLTLLRVGTLVVDGRRDLCLIRNVSSQGLMLHVYPTLHIGQKVEVEMKTGQQLAGHVKWINGSNAGVQFTQAIDVMAMLTNQLVAHAELKPRMPRVEVRAPATLRMGGHSYRVMTCDISQGGVKVALDTVLPPDANVVLSMEGFTSLHGVVRWSDGVAAGVTFNSVLPWPQLIGWLKERRDIGPPRDTWRPRANLVS